jgi:hypothetical protein
MRCGKFRPTATLGTNRNSNTPASFRIGKEEKGFNLNHCGTALLAEVRLAGLNTQTVENSLNFCHDARFSNKPARGIHTIKRKVGKENAEAPRCARKMGGVRNNIKKLKEVKADGLPRKPKPL